jgi:hypothetical protein
MLIFFFSAAVAYDTNLQNVFIKGNHAGIDCNNGTMPRWMADSLQNAARPTVSTDVDSISDLAKKFVAVANVTAGGGVTICQGLTGQYVLPASCPTLSASQTAMYFFIFLIISR